MKDASRSWAIASSATFGAATLMSRTAVDVQTTVSVQRWTDGHTRAPSVRDPGVDEAPVGVQPLADRGEVGPARVARRELLGAEERALAPVRPAVPARASPPRPRGTAPRTPCPRTRARRRRRVSRACAGESSASSPAEKRSSIGNETGWRARISRARPHRLGRARPRQRVLHLLEAHEPRAGEHVEGLRHALALATPRGPPARLMAGIARGARRADAVEQPERVVVHRDVLQPLEPRPPRRRRRVGAVVGARQRERRVREREQLEVVVAVDVLVERVEHVLERQRPVDGVEAEGGHAAQGDRRDDPERAKPDARGAQLVAAVDGAAPSRRRARAPSPRRREARLPSRAPVPCVPVASAPASDCASMSPRFGSARPWRVQLAHEPVQGDARLGAHEPARAVDVEHAVEALEREQRPVGRRRRRRTSGRRPPRAPRARGRRPRPARPGSPVARARRARTTARATSSTTCCEATAA